MSVVTQTDWRSLASRLKPRSQAFIGGQFVDALSGRTFPTYNPATGRVITEVAACDAEDVDRAVVAARRAFESGVWRDLKPAERKSAMLRWASLIRENLTELALLETLDTGKAIKESVNVDVASCAAAIQWYAECTDKLYDEVAPNGPTSLVMVTREPVGVVAAVVPWNYPLIISSWKIGPAMAAGNSMILKPAEQSSLSALKLAELAQEAGIPDGVFNVVPGLGHEAGQAIGLHQDIDAVMFTGSTEVGRKFLEYSARSNLKRVGLELGGKSPHIVTEDADLEKAAMYVAYAIWYNMGETCNAGSRLIVHRSVKDRLLELVRPWAERLYPGDPLEATTELGALISAEHCDRVKHYIELGQQEGARVAIGGRQILQETGGWYVEPTVLDNVQNDMRVAREEIFGPVLVAIEYDDLEEAVAIANDSEYGLAAALWCRDITKAHLTARRLRAGTVWINAFDHTSINAPFGGYKQSGHGRDKSLHAFDKVTELKTTWVELH
ncbi:MAG: aldehyde dehydrogenase [Meiothermus sp.]|nr:aldehyde dehydrogenase [Meiothermus sp.]